MRERIDDLTGERAQLSLEITERQGRYALVTTELTHLEALVALHDGRARAEQRTPLAHDAELRQDAGVRPVQNRQAPSSAVLGESAAANAERPASPQRAAAPVATPPDGAWKAEAIRLLEEQGQPIHYRDLYRALAARGFVFGGRNPEGVLLTGVSREKQVFVSMGRGAYWLAGREPKAAQPDAAPPKPHTVTRRPRPIGQARRRSA